MKMKESFPFLDDVTKRQLYKKNIVSLKRPLVILNGFTFQYYNVHRSTVHRLRNYADISLVCDAHVYNEGENFTDYSTVEFLSEVKTSCNTIYIYKRFN